MFRSMVLISAAMCACLSACGPDGGVASVGTAAPIAAVADATLPPPSAVSPLAQTIFDDAAIHVAFQALDTAATAADTALAFKPSIAGTASARDVADALDGTRTWLNIASQAQRAQQADSYVGALQQANAALAGAQAALLRLKGK